MQDLALRVAFLWHNHQPYYEIDGEFLLPWVRFHGIKDYRDLPMLFREYPKVKHIINIVPSLFLQIQQYIQHKKIDKVQKLSFIHADQLTAEEKQGILKQFFVCNEEHLIKPYPRYFELFQKSKNENAMMQFSVQDFRDLQLWYNLSWFGNFAKKESPVSELFSKGSNFSEEDKLICLEYQLKVMGQILPILTEMQNNGQIEVSTTPFYHPIIPLIINSDAAFEAKPDNPKLEQPFRFPQDADLQVKNARKFYEDIFGSFPIGLWPSEGSISNDSLKLFAGNQFQWAASDESILFASEKPKTGLEKYFPRKFNRNNNELTLFFRDHNLSDKIGFEYQKWKPQDAANDFIANLLNIRTAILNNYGENGIHAAIVPIIMDGENCWEYYSNNGENFLRELFSRLSETDEIETVRFCDILNDGSNNYLPEIDNIRAGSWINANFDIWIGTNTHLKAWEMLRNARTTFESNRQNLSPEITDEILNEILIAEGSDWFWWYAPYHQSENKQDFDILFRYHIKRIYELMNLQIPDEVNHPIIDSEEQKIHNNTANENSTMERSNQ